MNSQQIRKIKDSLDFVELVNRYVHLRPAGERWTGLCPFHHETKPSFSVHPGQGFYYCFGCQASGDVIDFYARINGLDFKQALIQLAAETGVELDFGPMDPQEKQSLAQRQIFLRMYAQSAEYFQRNLDSIREEEVPRKYLHERGVSAEMLAAFGLGWSRPDWHGLEKFLRSKGYAMEQAVACGLLVQNERGHVYDRFRNRVMFPIHDLAGRIVAFGGRTIDSAEPKYINSSETPIYTKGQHLYGLYQARRAIVRDRRALLTEGYLDVIALHQFGFTQAVGVLGTALTAEQVRKLAGFCARVDLVFDGDQAGLKAAVRAAEMFLVQGLRSNVVTLPEGEDVDSVLHKQGPKVLHGMIDQARDGLDFCLQVIRKNYSPGEIVDWVGRFLDAVGNKALLAFYLPRLAVGLDMSEAELRRGRKTGGVTFPGPNVALQKQPKKTFSGLCAKDRQLLTFATRYPKYREQLAAYDLPLVLESDWAKAFWGKLFKLGSEQDLQGFSDEEKHFFHQALTDELVLNGDQDVTAWDEIRMFLKKHQRKNRQKQLLQDMRLAQDQGDKQSGVELLKLYQDFVRETE
jgi:DNA primase